MVAWGPRVTINNANMGLVSAPFILEETWQIWKV
jgi:hypothetical protein